MHKYHHTARMIVWSCCLSLGSVMFALIHYAQYASDGRGAYSMLVGSRVLFVLSDVLMVLLLISLAKGWTIVRSKVSIMGRVKIAIYIMTYLAASIACLITFYTIYDSFQVHFFYGTILGGIGVYDGITGVIAGNGVGDLTDFYNSGGRYMTLTYLTDDQLAAASPTPEPLVRP